MKLKSKFLDKHPLIIDYKFGRLIRKKYEIMNLIPIYNEAKNLNAYFTSTLRLADGIIILDDGSNDASWKIIDRYDYTLKIKVKRQGVKFNEPVVRNLLLKILEEVFLKQEIEVDWVLWLDCDEIIGNSDRQLQRLKQILKSETNELLSVYYFHMWTPDHYNLEYPYTDQGIRHSLKLFKNVKAKRPFQLTPTKPLHFQLEPYKSALRGLVPLKIKHYGTSTRAKRIAKYLTYTRVYDTTGIQKSYEHLLHHEAKVRLFSRHTKTMNSVPKI